MRRYTLLLFLYYCFNLTTALQASENPGHFLPSSLKDYKAFSAVNRVENRKVQGATVVYANYKLLKKDFPFLSSWTQNEINRWLIEHMTSISDRQFLLSHRTTEIPAADEVVMAYRQRHHGRGDFLAVQHPHTGEHLGFIDRKGTGVYYKHLDRNIELLQSGSIDDALGALRTNGLLHLAEGLKELFMDTAREVLELQRLKGDHHFIPKVVENYALIKFPFDIIVDSQGTSHPASLILRQANVGRVWIPGWQTLKSTIKADGSDGLMKIIDAGSFYFRDKELFPYFKEEWLRGKERNQRFSSHRLPGHKVLPELLEQVLSSENSQEIIENHLLKMSEEVRRRKEQLGGHHHQQEIKKLSLEDSLNLVYQQIVKDPIQHANFLQTVSALLFRDQRELYDKPIVYEAIRKVLNIPNSEEMMINSGDYTQTRFRAFPLLPILPFSEAKTIIEKELEKKIRNHAGLSLLAERAWLFPFENIESLLPQIVNYNPREFVSGLKVKLMEPDFIKDSRGQNFFKMAQFALHHDVTRPFALEHFIDLVKNRRFPFSAAQLIGRSNTRRWVARSCIRSTEN